MLTVDVVIARGRIVSQTEYEQVAGWVTDNLNRTDYLINKLVERLIPMLEDYEEANVVEEATEDDIRAFLIEQGILEVEDEVFDKEALAA